MNPTCTITYDIPRQMMGREPRRGDFIRTVSRRDGSTNSVYLVVQSHEVRRRVPSPNRRFKLVVQRGYGAHDLQRAVGMIWDLHWYSRR